MLGLKDVSATETRAAYKTVAASPVWTVGHLMAWQHKSDTLPCGHGWEYMGRVDVDHRYCKVCEQKALEVAA